jgi:hypothetical protein
LYYFDPYNQSLVDPYNHFVEEVAYKDCYMDCLGSYTDCSDSCIRFLPFDYLHKGFDSIPVDNYYNPLDNHIRKLVARSDSFYVNVIYTVVEEEWRVD